MLWEKHMKSEKHIAGLRILKEKLKSGDVEKPRPKLVQPKEVKTDEVIIVEEEIKSEPQNEKIKDNLKKLLTFKEEVNIPKVIFFKKRIFLIKMRIEK